MENPRMRIDITRTGSNAGEVTFEGLRDHDECMAQMKTIAVASGRIVSEESIHHGDDDTPVHDSGYVTES